MSFRDKSKLKDYLRNNSGSKLIDEIKKDFENNRKAWFENKSTNFPFGREGFPFENEDLFGKKSDPGIKSHLEDLAKKHPEFAGDLKHPLWGEPIDKNWENAYTIPVAVEKGDQSNQPSTSQSKQPTETDSRPNSQPGNLNGSNDQNFQPQEPVNTQPQMENKPNDQSQESKEPKRFTSKIEITPVNPYEETASSASASNTQGDVQKDPYQPGTPNSGRKQPQVRHIPIFVEGRSEPVVPKNAASFQNTNQFPHAEQQIPIKRKFDNSTENAPRKQDVPVTPIPVHIEKTKSKPAENNPKPAETKPKPTEAPKPPERQQFQKPDPMTRVAEVQNEVNDLTAEVEKFSGKSRTEKAYLYLDEMLTRNLIKLDTIEVEGNDKLRVARKDVIKSIQNAIALLESKVPLPTPTDGPEQPDEEMNNSNDKSADNGNSNTMTIDEQSSQNENKTSANDGGGAVPNK